MLTQERQMLPTPSADDARKSQGLLSKIKQAILEGNGAIRFSTYMEMALYDKTYGYYATNVPMTKEGDYITSPMLGPLFANTLAQTLIGLFNQLGITPHVIEYGAGTGQLAHDLLQYFKHINIKLKYTIVEISETLRTTQQKTLGDHLEQCEWVDSVDGAIGIIIMNEVLDAQPVQLIKFEHNKLHEAFIKLDGDALTLVYEPTTDPAILAQEADFKAKGLPQPYHTEYHGYLPGWAATLTKALSQGVGLIFDYGYEANSYHHPERSMGTITCFYQQRNHHQFLWSPGLCDITAHVNFSSLAEALHQRGAQILGYNNQANFLLNCGILSNVEQTDDPLQQLQHSQQLKQLLMPQEMGELFKVLTFGMGEPVDMPDFSMGDRLHAL